LLPCRYPPSCVSVPPASLLPPVSPTPTPSRSCLDPHSGYRFPFHEPKSTSRLPWATSDGTATFRQLHRLRSLDPSASPFLPNRVAPTWRPILSWVSSPPELSPTAPWVLDPPRPRGPEPAPSPEDLEARQEGSSNPPCRVSPPEHQKHSKDLVDGFQPQCEAGPDHLPVVPLLP